MDGVTPGAATLIASSAPRTRLVVKTHTKHMGWISLDVFFFVLSQICCVSLNKVVLLFIHNRVK